MSAAAGLNHPTQKHSRVLYEVQKLNNGFQVYRVAPELLEYLADNSISSMLTWTADATAFGFSAHSRDCPFVKPAIFPHIVGVVITGTLPWKVLSSGK